MAKKKRLTVSELEQQRDDLKKALKSVKGVVSDDALQAISNKLATTKKELNAAKAAEKRAEQKHDDTVNAALKVWIGGEVLAITGLSFNEIDVKAVSKWLEENADTCRYAIEKAVPLSTDEASKRCEY